MNSAPNSRETEPTMTAVPTMSSGLQNMAAQELIGFSHPLLAQSQKFPHWYAMPDDEFADFVHYCTQSSPLNVIAVWEQIRGRLTGKEAAYAHLLHRVASVIFFVDSTNAWLLAEAPLDLRKAIVSNMANLPATKGIRYGDAWWNPRVHGLDLALGVVLDPGLTYTAATLFWEEIQPKFELVHAIMFYRTVYQFAQRKLGEPGLLARDAELLDVVTGTALKRLAGGHYSVGIVTLGEHAGEPQHQVAKGNLLFLEGRGSWPYYLHVGDVVIFDPESFSGPGRVKFGKFIPAG